MCNLERGDFFQVTFFCGSSPICQFGENFDVMQRAKVCIILQIRRTVSHFKVLLNFAVHMCFSWQLKYKLKQNLQILEARKHFLKNMTIIYLICNLIKL